MWKKLLTKQMTSLFMKKESYVLRKTESWILASNLTCKRREKLLFLFNPGATLFRNDLRVNLRCIKNLNLIRLTQGQIFKRQKFDKWIHRLPNWMERTRKWNSVNDIYGGLIKETFFVLRQQVYWERKMSHGTITERK